MWDRKIVNIMVRSCKGIIRKWALLCIKLHGFPRHKNVCILLCLFSKVSLAIEITHWEFQVWNWKKKKSGNFPLIYNYPIRNCLLFLLSHCYNNYQCFYFPTYYTPFIVCTAVRQSDYNAHCPSRWSPYGFSIHGSISSVGER